MYMIEKGCVHRYQTKVASSVDGKSLTHKQRGMPFTCPFASFKIYIFTVGKDGQQHVGWCSPHGTDGGSILSHMAKWDKMDM